MLTEDQTILFVDKELQEKAIEYLSEEQYVEAISIYEQCIEADPTCISNYCYLGLALLLQGEESEAQAVWLSAIVQIKSEQIENYLRQLIQYLTESASGYLQSLSFLKAEKIYWNILELEPNYIQAYINLGVILYNQNRLDEAIACFHKAIEIQPNFAEAYNNLGIIFLRESKLDEAASYLYKAIEIVPDSAKYKNNLSSVIEVIKGQEAGYSPRIGQGYRLWDPWLFKDGDIYRLFYLTADDKSPHFWCVGEVGAAISTDMKKWNYLGIVHKPCPEYEWESGRILAGNLYKENGIYYLFYSASPSGASLLNEKIGLATSVDGQHWQRCSNFVLKPDTRFYTNSCNFQFSRKETFEIDQHWQWRDPCIVKEINTGKYYMFITAASCQGTPYFRGCIGLAVANKIDGSYNVLPPAAYPTVDGTDESIFYEMERPQVIYKNNQYHLFFSSRSDLLHPKWLERIGKDRITDSSLYWYVSDKIIGPFQPAMEKPVVKGSEKTGLYGTNFIEDPNGEFIAYGWYMKSHTLEVSTRFPVCWEKNYIEIMVD